MKKLFSLGLIILSLLSGCSNSKGPYNKKTLNEIKPADESTIFEKEDRIVDFHINERSWTIIMRYEIGFKNFIASEFHIIEEENEDNLKNKEIAREFVDNYYFLNKEKLEFLFKPESIDAGYFNMNKRKIIIKQYINIENKKNYHYFEYGEFKDYLFLQYYSYHIDDQIDFSHFFVRGH